MRFERAVPVLRVFDQDKAELIIHLSEHHGDGTPGSVVFRPLQGIREFHAELTDRNYRFAKPGLIDEPWGLTVDVTDPFGNQLRFCEQAR